MHIDLMLFCIECKGGTPTMVTGSLMDHSLSSIPLPLSSRLQWSIS